MQYNPPGVALWMPACCLLRVAHTAQVHALEAPVQHPWVGPRWVLAVGCTTLKGSRADWLVEKATELGAAEIVPLVTQRSQVGPGHAPGSWELAVGVTIGEATIGLPNWCRVAMGAAIAFSSTPYVCRAQLLFFAPHFPHCG